MVEIRINRAPFLALWATVVARRAGYGEDEALSLGKAITGLTAQSKGQRLGMYTPRPEAERASVRAEREAVAAEAIPFMGRTVPCLRTPEGLRALAGTAAIAPEGARKYLQSKFKENLAEVEGRLTALAATFEPEEIEAEAMDVYMRLRPEVPAGKAGWGKAGDLDLGKIDALTEARRKRQRRG